MTYDPTSSPRTTGRSTTIEALFEQADGAFDRKNYREAIDTYRAIRYAMSPTEKVSRMAEVVINKSMVAYRLLKQEADTMENQIPIVEEQVQILDEFLHDIGQWSNVSELSQESIERFEQRRDLLERQLEALVSGTRPQTDPAVSPCPFVPPPPDKRERALRRWGIALNVIGGLSLATGLVAVTNRYGLRTMMDSTRDTEDGTAQFDAWRLGYSVAGRLGFGTLVSSAVILPVGIVLQASAAGMKNKRTGKNTKGKRTKGKRTDEGPRPYTLQLGFGGIGGQF